VPLTHMGGIEEVLQVVGSGHGGLDELRDNLDDNAVQWALFRLDLGSGAFRRQKTLFLHMNGEGCPPVLRGRVNELTGEAQRLLCGGCDEHFHASLEVTRKSEVNEEHVVDRVQRYFIVDDLGEHSAEWFKTRVGVGPARYSTSKTGRPSVKAPLRRAISLPEHSSTSPYKTGREALRAVAEGIGIWNWLLVGPDPLELPLASGGPGSVDEMREYLRVNEEQVLYGVIRLGFGAGRLKRVKHVFVHAIGAKVPAIKRGRHNAARAGVEQAMAQRVTLTTSIQLTRVEELTLETLVEKVTQVSVVDQDVLDSDPGTRQTFSVESAREALREEREVAKTKAVQSCNKRLLSSGAGLSVEEALRLIHAPLGSLMWTIFAPRELKRRISASYTADLAERGSDVPVSRRSGRRHTLQAPIFEEIREPVVCRRPRSRAHTANPLCLEKVRVSASDADADATENHPEGVGSTSSPAGEDARC